MESTPSRDEAAVLQQIIEALSLLEPKAREKIVKTIMTFFELPSSYSKTSAYPNKSRSAPASPPSRELQFGGHPPLSPKQFILEKAPQTDVERVVCLAYYLVHYRDIEHFPNADISNLNTEAAQRKFTNTAHFANLAMQAGYLAAATKNEKQLSAMGEQFVQALPDREAAKEIRGRPRPKRARKKTVPSDGGT